MFTAFIDAILRLKKERLMTDITAKILSAKQKKKSLFYNDAGNKKAYQLGVKHLSSAEFLGFADSLPNGDLRIKKELLLVDFERNEIIRIQEGSLITPVKLESG
jgi:hypothetical protein